MKVFLPALGFFGVWTATHLTGQAHGLGDKPVSPVSVAMKDCEASRRGKMTLGELGDPKELLKNPEELKRLLAEAMKPESLVKKGTIRVKAGSFDIYLPEATPPYSVTNEGGEGHSSNTSTLVSVDANGDGVLTEDEGWFANVPIRLADEMWEIVSIASDGSELQLRPSRTPLQGVVVGRKCPPFTYRTENGTRVTLDTYRGKTLLLDIWSVT